MKTALALGLTSSALICSAQPAAQLTYHGNVEGLTGQVTMQFRDIRTTGTPGFYIVAGRPAWVLFDALIGYIEMGAQLATPTASYLFGGNLYTAWTYVDLIDTAGTDRIQSRIDFASDGRYVYLDAFQLTVNPLGPGPVVYYFTMDPLPDDPNLPPINPNERPTDLGQLDLVLSPGGVPTIQWKSTPGWKYRVTYKDSFAAAAWSSLGEVLATAATSSLEDAKAADSSHRYYRLELE